MASEPAHPAPATTPVDASQAVHLHGFAHDLKNRLAGLLEVLRQLRDPSITAEQRELFDFGERQVFAVLRRTDELLDELKVPRAMPAPRCEPVDLNGALHNAIGNQRYRFDRKQQAISVAHGDRFIVAADTRQLATVLEALLSNASKFSPNGSVITVSATGGSGQVSVEVRDMGVGLNDHDVRDVFIRYAWLGSASTAGETQGRSTLAHCRSIAEAHGGSLSVRSDGPGKGSCFTLRLPSA